MAEQLQLYQYRKQPLIQLTDGRAPHARADQAGGWELRENIPASIDGVAAVTSVAPSMVLGEIKSKGWCELEEFDIRDTWRRKWAVKS